MKNQKLKKVVTYLLDRLQEPSTIRGLVLLGAALGAKMSVEQQAAYLEIGLLLAGLIAILTPDKLKEKEIDVEKRRSGGGAFPIRGTKPGESPRTQRQPRDGDSSDEYDIKG